MRSNTTLVLLLSSVVGLPAAACGGDDDGSRTDGGSGSMVDAGPLPGDGGMADTDGAVPPQDAGPPPGDPCSEGAIETECVCAGALHVTGYCCRGSWFDPVYEDLTGGCPADSAYRYVDPTHAMATDDGPGTEGMPWATIEHGVATVAAGQVLLVRAGTYRVRGTASRYTPALVPGHSGTPGAPVVVKADGEVIVTSAPVHTGTARGGTPESIVLDESASSEDEAYARSYVRIVSGTGAGQSRRILRDFDDFGRTSYEGATHTAWVSLDSDGAGAWETTPDETSAYEIVVTGPLLGTLDNEHVVWDGFHVVERDSYASDTGPVVLWGSRDVALLHCDVEAQETLLYDNHNAVRIEGTERALVRSNRLHGVLPIEIDRNNPQNHAALMIYSSSDLVIEHNEIYDSYTGVFPKGGDRGHVIRYNLVRDTTKAFRVSYHEDLRIHGNVVRDSLLAFQAAENNADVRIFNNVVHRTRSGLSNWFAVAGVDVFNNVFSEVARPADFEGEAGTFTMHHNAFHMIDDFVIGNANVGGFDAWQSLGYGDGSMEIGAPFVDADGGDYRLVDGSPAGSGGRDFEDLDGDADTAEAVPMGVYVTGAETVGLVR